MQYIALRSSFNWYIHTMNVSKVETKMQNFFNRHDTGKIILYVEICAQTKGN